MVNLQKVINDLSNKGFSRNEILEQLGISAATLSKYIEADITPTGQQIIELRQQGKTLKEIAQFLNCSKSTASKWAKRVKQNEQIKQANKEKSDKQKRKQKPKSIKNTTRYSQWKKDIRNHRRSYLISLFDNKCCLCGYSKCQSALEFHHIKDKKFNISSNNLLKKLDTIIEEIQKCVLLCANCHREAHEFKYVLHECMLNKPIGDLPSHIQDYNPLFLTDEIIEEEKLWIQNKKQSRALKIRAKIEINLNNVIIKETTHQKVNDILSDYHYLGPSYKQPIKAYVYEVDQRVIGAALVTNPVRHIANTCELSRFCLTVECNNLATKCISLLIRELKKNVSIMYLQSFSDNDSHLGTIYKASNFRMVGGSHKTYNYDGIHKKTIYNRALSLGLTEHEYADTFGLNRIIESPKTKWLYKL